MEILEKVPLAPLTTLRVGGSARYFIEALSIGEAEEAVAFSRSRDLPLFVLGGGSNVVIADSGFPGLVLKISILGIEQRSGHDGRGRIVFDVGAGEPWDRFVSRAVVAHCAGVECLSGIPGSVGGTPVQNVGAYGQEVGETTASVQVLDVKDGQVHELDPEACQFGYRSSIFNRSGRGRYIVLGVSYALIPDGKPRLDYADLKRHFAGRESKPNLAETREAVRHIRALKGMLIVPGEQEAFSAGSFFKNPLLTHEQHQDLERRAAARRLTVPSYPALQTQKKVSAAWLVERSGFAKGHGFGPVGISSKHALALVNRGGASTADILALKDQIQQRVEEIWGVHLQMEPVLVGF
ncbi:MAG: UDP-N-acetylmuramate dehydrogenase [Candidatus Sulfotelmatobacter sp.]